MAGPKGRATRAPNGASGRLNPSPPLRFSAPPRSLR